MIRIADFVIKYLEKRNIETVFTVSGGGSIFLCDAIYSAKKIKYISHHHEQAASFAAESYARASKKIGCCVVTTGPGGTNSITGVSSAWIDSVPVIFISGQVFLNQTIKKTKKRQIGVQEINIIDLVKPNTKFAKMITDSKKIFYYLEKAFYEATTGRPGPVWLDIPADIQSLYVDEKELYKYKFLPSKNKNKIDDKIKYLAKKIVNANKPLIHLGHGVKLSNSGQIIKKFFSKYKIPFVLTWNADDIISNSHPLYFGKPGAFGNRSSNFIVQNTDCYLSVGTRLPFMVTGYNAKNFAKNAKFKSMVDIDTNELNKNDLKIDLKIKSDAKIFFEKLYKEIKKYKPNQKWISYCKKIYKKYPIIIDDMKKSKNFVNSYFFVDRLSRQLKKRDSIVTDMGFSFTSSHQAITLKENQTFYTNSGHAPMGWGLPAAIGAYFAMKKISYNFICLTGEGGFQMNIQELSTVMHHKIPLKIFIFNNGGYLTIKQTQILGFKGRIMGADKKSGLSFPKYKEIAKAHNLEYRVIKNHKKLENEISKILKLQKACICELIMDPNEEQIPKAINRRDTNGKSVPTELEDMYPFLPKEELNSNYIL